MLLAGHASSASDSIATGGIINDRLTDWTAASGWNRDEEKLLAEMGWRKEHLTRVSNMHQMIHLQLAQLNGRRLNSHPPQPGHYSQLCPGNITIDSTIFGRIVRETFLLNKYLNSPSLMVKTIFRYGHTNTSTVGAFSQCFYQSKNEVPFGTVSIDTEGYLR